MILDEKKLTAIYKKTGVTTRGINFIKKVREGEPVRRVNTTGFHVPSRFPSKKMGLTIQSESLLELAYVLKSETSDAVYEFYDQPVKLDFFDKKGKKVSYIPDYFEISESGCDIVEVKNMALQG